MLSANNKWFFILVGFFSTEGLKVANLAILGLLTDNMSRLNNELPTQNLFHFHLKRAIWSI